MRWLMVVACLVAGPAWGQARPAQSNDIPLNWRVPFEQTRDQVIASIPRIDCDSEICEAENGSWCPNAIPCLSAGLFLENGRVVSSMARYRPEIFNRLLNEMRSKHGSGQVSVIGPTRFVQSSNATVDWQIGRYKITFSELRGRNAYGAPLNETNIFMRKTAP